MAVVLANARDKKGNLCFDVIGIDLPHRESYLQTIMRGEIPFACEDASFAKELRHAIVVQDNLRISSDEQFYENAEVVVVDVHLDVEKLNADDYRQCRVHKEPFENAMRTLGERINRDCLVLVETTVSPGFCTRVVLPILCEAFGRRGIKSEPLLAHSYERVMPGKHYLKSIRECFRTYSATTDNAKERCKNFLSKIIDVENYPLKKEDSPEASELAKILENSYRALNIAFIYEWTLLAEKMGVNLFSVIEGIRKRSTHSNIMFPGIGVGGYCLTKDALLAQWSADNLYDSTYGLPFSVMGLEVNDKMPLHVVEIIQEKEILDGQIIAILGVSYREDIGDTRFSPTEVLYKKLKTFNVSCFFHDQYVENWNEVPEANFVRTIDEIKSADVIILATRHAEYLEHSESDWLNMSKENALFVDANNILNDYKIAFLLRNKRRVVGVGKGHLSKLVR